jgi:flagellar biosynthesis protein FlhG
MRTKVLAVTSGKGGVGKTNVAANLAVTLSELGEKVVVLDADFGLANIDVLLGLTPRFHLGHVLLGDKTLSEIMIEGPRGVKIIPASSGLQRLAELSSSQRSRLAANFCELYSEADFFIIDTAAGISQNVIHFLRSAQEVIVVSAPEPTAIVDAYAVIKILLTEDSGKCVHVLVNSAHDGEEARQVFNQINSVVRRFLKREVSYLGHVESDPHVSRAVRSQVLVTDRYPNAPASRCFRELAQVLAGQHRTDKPAGRLIWQKLLNEWVN